MSTTPYGSARTSPQRLEIARVAAAVGKAFTAEELASRLADEGSVVGLATVYRALAALEASGYLARVGSREGAALYVRCADSEHHHHLVCEQCGRVAHATCPIDDATIDDARQDGFEITRHEVTLYGLCAACRRDDDGNSRGAVARRGGF